MEDNPLHSTVYSGDIEQSVFQEILACLDHVKPQFISREEYEEKYKDDFLVQVGEDKFGEHYDLFLPEDLQYIELLRIIDILNQKFDIEKYAKFDELLVKTKVAVGKILQQDGGKEKVDTYIGDSGISLYLQGKIGEADIMGNMSLAKEVLRENKKGTSLEKVVSDIYGQEFEKTFFRRGVNMLRLGLMTFTQDDAIELDGKEGDIVERSYRWSLDKQEVKLREAINIDGWSTRIANLRHSGDTEQLAQQEIKFCKMFIKELMRYPYQANDDSFGSPKQIAGNKEMQCLGFSICAHAILKEVGIKHQSAYTENHAFLILYIGGEEYIFDGARSSKSKMKNFLGKRRGFVKAFGDIECGNTENNLLAQLYNNTGNSLSDQGRYEEAIGMCNKAIELNSSIVSSYLNKGSKLEKLNKYEEAIEMYNKAIELNPDSFRAYGNKGIALWFLGRYEEAIKMYSKAIELNPKITSLYTGMGACLANLGRYEEAVSMFDIAINLNPQDTTAHNNRRISLKQLDSSK